MADLFESPTGFREAITALLRKDIAPEGWDTATVKTLDKAVTRQSFFSSGNFYEGVLGELKSDVAALVSPMDGEQMDMGTARMRVRELLSDLGEQTEDEDEQANLQRLATD